MSETEEPEWRNYTLHPQHELRLETEDLQGITVKLTSGTAEIYGVELATDREYVVKHRKLAIYTYRGCEMMILGECSLAYQSSETPMVQYINVHYNLEIMRKVSFDTGNPGPRVLVVGPQDSGKSVLSNILVNYAIRSGHQPIFVDLDVSCNEFAGPGSIAASPIVHPKDVEDDEFPSTLPIVYFYGYTSVAENKEHFDSCVQQMSAVLQKRIERHGKENCSGYIINTGAWSESIGVEGVTYIATAFKVDVILVLGHERLAALLKQQSTLSGVEIVALPKSGGVVQRDMNYRKNLASRKWRSYFYGKENELNPRQIVLHSGVGIYKVGGTPQAPSSTLPIGEARLLKPNKILPITPSAEFSHAILALSTARDPDQLLSAPVCGFLHVSAFDAKRKSLTVLSPQGAPLPANCLLYGSIKCVCVSFCQKNIPLINLGDIANISNPQHLVQILQSAPIQILKKICQTDQNIAEMCEALWMTRTQKRFKVNSKDTDKSWRQTYLELEESGNAMVQSIGQASRIQLDRIRQEKKQSSTKSISISSGANSLSGKKRKNTEYPSESRSRLEHMIAQNLKGLPRAK